MNYIPASHGLKANNVLKFKFNNLDVKYPKTPHTATHSL